MHRVRVGLIGLAWVFLLVMIATTFLHATGTEKAVNATLANTQGPSEPLAELGVAPGNPTAAAPPTPTPLAGKTSPR